MELRQKLQVASSKLQINPDTVLASIFGKYKLFWNCWKPSKKWVTTQDYCKIWKKNVTNGEKNAQITKVTSRLVSIRDKRFTTGYKYNSSQESATISDF